MPIRPSISATNTTSTTTQRAADEYLDWTRKWIGGVQRALKPNGTFWLAIGDEYAAELKLIAQRDFGFTCRSWVIWYYTFGVNCVRGFSRSHTHLFHFVCDPANFTFNADNPAVRVPSARQLVYADSRANPKGRLPDNTWILRPQDLPGGFRPDHDTWYFPRVAGTFKEREGFHGCQMPEQLLGRIIRTSSNPLDVVLDPFGGSGTTFSVAKKLGRQWLGFELSKDYVERIQARLKQTAVGDPLDGAADPATSAPSTAKPLRPRRRLTPEETAQIDRGIIAAYKKTHQGLSVDHLVADPERNAAFLEACKKIGVPGFPAQWNLGLMRIRKSGKLPAQREPHARSAPSSRWTATVSPPKWPCTSLAWRSARRSTACSATRIWPAASTSWRPPMRPAIRPLNIAGRRWRCASGPRRPSGWPRRSIASGCGDRCRGPRSCCGGKWSDFNCPGVYVLHGGRQ